jgi:Ca-activated chloride channel family protein
MSFAAPIWLYLTPILFLIFGAMLAYGFRRRDALLARFAASRLLDQLTEKAGLARTWIKAACILLAVVAIGFSLARPQLGVEWSERKARGLDIVFVLDSSKSMLATDQRPTRLDRAKLAIIDLIERLESDRIGLIAFAGQAFLQTPPTLDYSAFRESLDAIDPNIMTSGGSDLGNALKEATKAFPSKNNVKVVVLLTDGEDLGGNAIQAAETAHQEGIQVFAIGIGTPEGEYLKIRNEQGVEEFVRDTNGQPVRSQLDESTLQQIARITDGSYSRLSGESLDQLYRNVIATLPREERESEMQEIKIERFQWALSAALGLLVLESLIRRRRSPTIHAELAILTLLAFCPNDTQAQQTSPVANTPIESSVEPTPTATPEQAEDETPTDALTLYNNAYQSIENGDYERAANLYADALATTDDLELQQDALYNMGHATYQQGRSAYESGDPQSALEQVKKSEALFKSALEMDPSDASIQEDLDKTSKVREAIEKLIEEQKQQQQQQSEQSDDSKQDGEQSEKQQNSEQNQDSSQQDQQQDDKEKQDQQNQSQQGDQGQQDQGESGDQTNNQDKQGQQGDPSQQDQKSQESPNSENASESQQSSEESTEDQQQAQGDTPQESTKDPVDDIPQPQAGDENDEAQNQDAQQNAVPNASEGDASEAQSGASISGEPVEGMTEAEAAALLDSLRGKETLLPFIDQQRSGRNRDTRDW